MPFARDDIVCGTPRERSMVAKQQEQTYSSLEPSPSHELRLRQERRHGLLFISFFQRIA